MAWVALILSTKEASGCLDLFFGRPLRAFDRRGDNIPKALPWVVLSRAFGPYFNSRVSHKMKPVRLYAVPMVVTAPHTRKVQTYRWTENLPILPIPHTLAGASSFPGYWHTRPMELSSDGLCLQATENTKV